MNDSDLLLWFYARFLILVPIFAILRQIHVTNITTTVLALSPSPSAYLYTTQAHLPLKTPSQG